MKLTDYVADFVALQGIRHVFAVVGGASIHMIHSFADREDVEYICPHHEQAGAMAADAYSRVTGEIGCALATSGPGATNLITGISGAWFDSVPVLYLTGQVTTFRFKGSTGVRQMGFQETEIVPMVRPITKYAVQITDPERIRYELEKAVYLAKTGRQGPVLVDIPDDLQRSQINPDDLVGFEPDEKASQTPPLPGEDIDRCIALIESASRPVLIVGTGVRRAGAEDEIRQLAERLQFPIVPSWGGLDMFPSDHPLAVGSFGTHGSRQGNFAVQNADLVLAIGARLGTRETGTPLDSWAREADTIVVDIDQTELDKFPAFGKPLTIGLNADARVFTQSLLNRLDESRLPNIDNWQKRVDEWKKAYPPCPDSYALEKPVNPYYFVQELSKREPEGHQVFIDTGCAIAWMMQGFKIKKGQRLFHDFNNTAMGWALPAAIGGSLANNRAEVTCVVGDGSFMFNLQELPTIKLHNLPIKIFILNNDGYSMVQQTQDQWLNSEYHATSTEGGLAFPDFTLIAEACGIPAMSIDLNAAVPDSIDKVLSMEGPVLCDVRIPSEHRVVPQSRFGFPIEDSEPYLDRAEFLRNMIVQPVQASLE